MKPIVVRFTLLPFSLVLATLMWASISAAKLNTDGLLAVWLFDEGATKQKEGTVEDSSGNEFDGKVVAGTLKWVEGKFGTALKFTAGPGYVQIDRPIHLEGDKINFSMGVWIHPGEKQRTWTNILSSHENARGLQRGFSFEQWDQNHNWWTVPIGTGQWQWNVDDAPGQNEKIHTKTKPGEWQQLSVVRDGLSIKMYLNGKLSYDGRGHPEAVQDAIGFNIGEAKCCKGRHLDGLVDEGWVFSRALTPEEIKSITDEGWEGALGVDPKGKAATTWGRLKGQRR